MVNQEDLKNLEIIFTLARQAAVHDEGQLTGVMNFKKTLFEKLTKTDTPSEVDPSKTALKVVKGDVPTENGEGKKETVKK